ncbi:TPM domain-containing protein [bacterium]|nr:TPM domain-containing protein [bacterium]
MGRHGGGSRSGGRSGGRSGSGSRSSGSRGRSSNTPFRGCYNRSYYNRRGKFVPYYTSRRSFGTKPGLKSGHIVALVFITFHMILMMSGMIASTISFGSKIDGDKSRIYINDKANVLSHQDESELIELFEDVYDASGMPVALCTDDFSWKRYYDSLEVYSEELYYAVGRDESAMLILFTVDDSDSFYDWEYDAYCGDDTIKCFSDATFDKWLDEFHKGLASQDLSDAMTYSWNTVIDELARTSVSIDAFMVLPIISAVYGLFYFVILSGVKREHDAYRYFKDNPDKLVMHKMDEVPKVYTQCPFCGASNTNRSEKCEYCGNLLIAAEDVTLKENNINDF